jgi:hypothetical protein
MLPALFLTLSLLSLCDASSSSFSTPVHPNRIRKNLIEVGKERDAGAETGPRKLMDGSRRSAVKGWAHLQEIKQRIQEERSGKTHPYEGFHLSRGERERLDLLKSRFDWTKKTYWKLDENGILERWLIRKGQNEEILAELKAYMEDPDTAEEGIFGRIDLDEKDKGKSNMLLPTAPSRRKDRSNSLSEISHNSTHTHSPHRLLLLSSLSSSSLSSSSLSSSSLSSSSLPSLVSALSREGTLTSLRYLWPTLSIRTHSVRIHPAIWREVQEAVVHILLQVISFCFLSETKPFVVLTCV